MNTVARPHTDPPPRKQSPDTTENQGIFNGQPPLQEALSASPIEAPQDPPDPPCLLLCSAISNLFGNVMEVFDGH